MQRAAIVATLVLAASACKKTEPKPSTGEGSAVPALGSSGPGSGAAPAPPDAAPHPAAPPATAEQVIDVPFLGGSIKVKALVPAGWDRRDQLPAWDPPDRDSLPMWHRSYAMSATCDGGCTPAELAAKVPSYLDAIKAHRIKPKMSGDPVKDEATVAPVTELARGDLPQGGMFLLLRVEKPVGSTDPYPDLFTGTCVTRRKDDEFMVVTEVAAAPDDEHAWWPVLIEACKATTIESMTPAPR